MELKWERAPVPIRRGRPIRPGGKWGHTVNAVGNGLLFVFGGQTSIKEGELDAAHNLNDVLVFDVNRITWSRLKPKGTPPAPRDSHSSTLVGKDLFVFGGKNGVGTLNDLHVLDTSAEVWRTPPMSGDIPPPREGHGAALIDYSLFIFGGTGTFLEDGEQKEKCLNDLYILDTRSFHWTKAETSGISPEPRSGPSCIAFRKMLFVFGGFDDCGLNNSYRAVVTVLNTNSMVWEELPSVGDCPAPRAGHTTVTLDKYLVVFGGFTDVGVLTNDFSILDMESGFWQNAYPSGEGPCPRFAGAGVCFDSQRGLFVFIGGRNGELEPLSDVSYLSILMPAPFPPENMDADDVQDEPVLGNDPQEGSSISMPEDLNTTASDIPTGTLFEAKITNVFHYGYQIKATIDGRPLRGVLFTKNPDHFSTVHKSLVNKKVEQRRNRRAAKLKNILGKSTRTTRKSQASSSSMTHVGGPVVATVLTV